MTKLRREIADLKRQQGNLIDLRQNDMIDLVMLENRIGPLNLRRDEKERELGVLEDQQNKKDDVLHAKERIAEYCRRLEEGLDNLEVEGKRATLAAFGVKVKATREDLKVTMEINPGATTIQHSSGWLIPLPAPDGTA